MTPYQHPDTQDGITETFQSSGADIMTGYGLGLDQRHVDKLASSAVAADVAAERGYVSAISKADLVRQGFSPSQRLPPALVIPLYGVDGERWGAQIRPDEPRSIKGRVVKYETAAGTKMALDVPRRVLPHLGDPTRPLVFTEGPLKADAAVSAGLDCVALLGVWNWKSGGVVLPDFEYIALKTRRVIVAFDSDAMLNPQVHGAMGRLGAVLTQRGADVVYLYLPAGAAGSKVGLDDWLAAGGTTDALWELCSPNLRQLPDPRDPADHGDENDSFDDVEVEPGAALLDDVAEFLHCYVAFPSTQAGVAAVLWVAHTHAIGSAESTPRLAVLSPERGSGKSRLLEVLELVVSRPRRRSSMTPATTYRIIALRQPTLLFDEVDAVFGPNAGPHEELRAVLNAGHRRGATVDRCVGDGSAQEVVEFPVFAAVALAGLGDLPDTVAQRSVILLMRRRAPDEHVESFRYRDAQVVARPLARRLAAWATRNADDLAEREPVMPVGVTDRPADVWEPLLAIADQAGGDWPDRARAAAVALIAEAAETTPSHGERLLADCRTVFAKDEKVSSGDLARRLAGLQEAPWGDLRGRPIDERGLARLLRPYGIRSRSIRIGTATPKGYTRGDFHESWVRYVSDGSIDASLTQGETATTATAATSAAPAPSVGAVAVGLSPPTQQPHGATRPFTCDVAVVADVAAEGRGAATGPHHVSVTDTEPLTIEDPTATPCECGADAAGPHRQGCAQRPRFVAV